MQCFAPISSPWLHVARDKLTRVRQVMSVKYKEVDGVTEGNKIYVKFPNGRRAEHERPQNRFGEMVTIFLFDLPCLLSSWHGSG